MLLTHTVPLSHNIVCMYRCVGKNCTALIELEVCRPVCVETYQDCKGLGRFMLRYCGNTIATGIVTKVSLAHNLLVITKYLME